MDYKLEFVDLNDHVSCERDSKRRTRRMEHIGSLLLIGFCTLAILLCVAITVSVLRQFDVIGASCTGYNERYSNKDQHHVRTGADGKNADNCGYQYTQEVHNETIIQTSEFAICPSLSFHSSNAILIDLYTGCTIFERGAEEQIFPASLVKIMTAIVAVEHIQNLEARIHLPEDIFPSLENANSSMAGFRRNDRVRARDLLYGLMLPSGGECAIGLARYVAGSEEAFAQLMNEKASELGMTQTVFRNATGLHHEEQISTVADLAILLEYAVENEIVHQLLTTHRHSTRATELNEGGITFHSSLFSRMESNVLSHGQILGGRTGFTGRAGQCLASFAEVHGRQFLLVTVGANGNPRVNALHIEDAFTIYNAIHCV